jgi:hypothetical protein
MKDISELIEKIVSDDEFRTQFFQNPQSLLKEYDVTITEKELEELKNLGATETDNLSEELSDRLSKSCSWQT